MTGTLKGVRIAAWLTIFALIAVTGWSLWRGGVEPAVTSSGEAAVGGPFTLVDTESKPVDQTIFAGRPHAVFFGFTHCPDVCPTTLGEMSLMLQDLGADADKLTVAFVTVDPERDTPAAMRDYLSAFDARIVGLTGSEQQIADVTAKYRVYRAKVPGENGDYTMDHTAAVFLFGSDGGFRGTISYGEKKEDALAKLKRLVAE